MDLQSRSSSYQSSNDSHSWHRQLLTVVRTFSFIWTLLKPRRYQRVTRTHHRSAIVRTGYRLWYSFWRMRPLYRRIGYATLTAILILSWTLAGMPGLPGSHLPSQVKAATQSAGPRTATGSGDCLNITGTGTVAWSTPGNAFSSTDSGASATAGLGRNVTSNWLRCMNFGFTTSMIPTGSSIVGIVATINRKVSSSNSTTTDAGVRLVISGVIQTTDRKTSTAWPTGFTSEDHGGATDLWGGAPDVSDVTGSSFGVAISATHGATTNSTFTFSVDYVTLTIYYMPPPPTLTQRHYLFENDDGANVNSNTDNGTADTALTNVTKGQRLEARFQVDNTGTPTFSNGQFELFYDHNDGLWSRVQPGPAVSGGGSCNLDANWDCNQLDSSSGAVYQSIAISPSGVPWVSYYDTTNSDLKIGINTGSGGSGCTPATWTCVAVDSTGTVGQYTSIAFSPSGAGWVSYYDATNGDLKVANYVGSSGTGCASTAWTCTTVDSTGNVGQNTKIAFDSTGAAWVSYYDVTNGDLKVANYVGSSGTGCASTAWTCTTVDSTGNVGQYNSIGITSTNVPWVSYTDVTNFDFKVAQYVGSGGSGCASSAWSCTSVDTSGNVGGNASSLAISPSGVPWVSYYDTTNTALKVAYYVASGGTGCASAAWTCTTVHSAASHAFGTSNSLIFSPTGTAIVGYSDALSGGGLTFRMANYVGASGSGCTSSAWNGCAGIDSIFYGGDGVQLALDPNGTIWAAERHASSGDFYIANVKRGSEIIPAYGASGSNGDALTTNAAGTCQTGTTFTNGTWQDGANVSSGTTLATNKCTEVSFMIDTSQATAGTTYRLALKDKTDNTGLSAYSVYPTLTIVSSGSDTLHASKDNSYRLSATCTDSTYDCEQTDSINASASVNNGRYDAITLDANGTPWAFSHDNVGKGVKYEKYTPGTSASGTCAANWTCGYLYNDGSTNTNVGITAATAPNGTMWVAFQNWDAKNAVVAQYVGSGGSGCGASGSTAWTCTVVDTNAVTEYFSIAFSRSGNPWVVYAQTTSKLEWAQYSPGSSASGTCAANWSCGVIDATAATDISQGNSIAFDQNGTAWVSYQDVTNAAVKVANYVGSGGNCTGSTGGAWNCTTVQTGSTSNGVSGVRTSMVINPLTNVPWFVYYNTTSTALGIAQYVGTGGSCSSSTAWNCSIIDNTGTDTGKFASMEADGLGNLVVSFYDATNTALRLAWYVGGSSGNCTSTAWSCTQVDNQGTDTGQWSSVMLDGSGTTWISYMNLTATAGTNKVAKIQLPPFKDSLKYKLDNLGYTNVATNDTNRESMAATTNIPLFNFDLVHGNNTDSVTPSWVGQTSVACSTNAAKLQVYRFGTTNAWQDVATGSSCSANTDFTLSAAISSNLSEYYDTYGSSYVLHFRVYQASGSSKTLQTNIFSGSFGSSGPTLDQLLQGGLYIVNGVKNAFTF